MEANDVVQIIDPGHAWHPALLVVSEPRDWGVIAYCHIPQSNEPGAHPGRAFIRLRHDQVVRIGAAVVVPAEEEG